MGLGHMQVWTQRSKPLTLFLPRNQPEPDSALCANSLGWGEKRWGLPFQQCCPPRPPITLKPKCSLAQPCSGHQENRECHLGTQVAEGSGSSSSRLQSGKGPVGQGCLPKPPSHTPSYLLTWANHRAGCKSFNRDHTQISWSLSPFCFFFPPFLPLFKSVSSLFAFLLPSFSTPLFRVLFFGKFRQFRSHFTFTSSLSLQNISLGHEALNDLTDIPGH